MNENTFIHKENSRLPIFTAGTAILKSVTEFWGEGR